MELKMLQSRTCRLSHGTKNTAYKEGVVGSIPNFTNAQDITTEIMAILEESKPDFQVELITIPYNSENFF
jgi:HAE1 family hydrophobic/amphiphilic exporter-1